MLTLENINKINGYSLEVKGKGYYFKGWDNTTSDVANFTLAGVSASNPLIKITLHKKGRLSTDYIQNTSCYIYAIEVDGLTFYFTKERLNTPSEFRNTIEQILNGI
jgi:YHS domain-containing protein